MYAYFAFHKIHMRPSEFAALPVKEKALIIAFIDEYEKEKKIYEERGWKGPYHIQPYLDAEEKIDVYEQVMMNWIPFINYLYANRYSFLSKKRNKV